MKIIYYVYVLKSLKDGNLYIGRTENFKNCIIEHNKGSVSSTKDRRPLRFMYCEASNNIKDSVHREKYLKTAWGKRYLKHRLKNDSV